MRPRKIMLLCGFRNDRAAQARIGAQETLCRCAAPSAAGIRLFRISLAYRVIRLGRGHNAAVW